MLRVTNCYQEISRPAPRLRSIESRAKKAQEQDRAINELSFLERLALLIDQQWSWRENQALARRLKAAKLRGPAGVEDIDYRTARGLDKTVVRALARDSSWVRNHENIFVLGPTGVGKSFIASALAQKACSRRLLGSLFAGCRLTARTGPGTGRWELAPLPGSTGPYRCSGH